MLEKTYHGTLATFYIQETSSPGQLDSISDSVDTTQPGVMQKVEVTLSKSVSRYLECDGNYKYFKGPFEAIVKAQKLLARAELLSALIGQDSLAGDKYTVTTATFSSEFAIHIKLFASASQELNLNLEKCVVTKCVLKVDSKAKEAAMYDAEIVGSVIGTVNWDRVT